MPHEGYDDPITNDGPGFHSNVPVSELSPSGCENHRRGNTRKLKTDPFQA